MTDNHHNRKERPRTVETTESGVRDNADSGNSSRRDVLKTVGGTTLGMGVGIGAFAGIARAHEVAEIVFCECVEVSVLGELLLGDEEPADATGDGGYEAVLYCDGTLVRRSLTGSQTNQQYSLLDDPDFDHEDCQIIAVEGQTFHHEEGDVTFRICNEHCGWDCADEGLAARDPEWCDDPSEIPSGGGAGGVDPNVDIVVTCVTDCREGDLQGCTPGYWKRPAFRNEVWTDADTYGPSDLVADTFDLAVTGSHGRGGNARNWDTMTLHEALDGGGGSGVEGAQKILIRAAVAALLNAQHEDINYPLPTMEVIEEVNAALATGDRDEILALAERLDEYNNLGCPLDAHGNVE